jgi:preprotein translocase subunit SecG
MSFIVGILTFLLVVKILLVLIQLPKKDAGAGLAFGGGAADALFGAGSGNALTKITKYATVIFFALAILLGYLEERVHNSGNASEFERQVQQKQMQTPIAEPPAAAPIAEPPAAAPLASQPAPTNSLLAMPLTSVTNMPAIAPTNAPAK